MKDAALWFAADPSRYRIVAYGLLVAFAACGVAGAISTRADRALSGRWATVAFLALGLLALAGGRWPTFFVKDSLNNDEGQAVAQAITALHFPTPWLGFDGNTCGPLNTYVLDIPALFGAPITFFSTRIVNVFLEFGAVFGMYAALATTVSKRVARLAAIGPIAFFALSAEAHYLQYAGETMSLFLASACVAYIAGIARWKHPAIAAFAAGLFVGGIPFAKLQAAPIAIALGALALFVALARDGTGAWKLRRGTATIAGVLVAPAVLLGWAFAAGSFSDFWYAYILSALGYILPTEQPLEFLTASTEVGPYFDCLIAVAALGAGALAVLRPRRLSGTQYSYLAALFILAATIDAIYSPRRASLNYLLFAIVPVAGAAGASLDVLFEAFKGRTIVRIAAPAFAIASIAFAPVASFFSPYPWLGSVPDYYESGPNPVTAMVERYVRPGDRMAIWGWRPQYFVFTDTIMGTRDSISHYQQTDSYNPYFAYFRKRYITDMQTIRPRAFLDAGPDSFDFQYGTRNGHEDFPELAAVIREHYRLADSYKSFRLYLRDRD